MGIARNIHAILREQYALAKVRLDASLAELGLNDLDLRDLAFYVRKRCGLSLEPGAFDRCERFSDLVAVAASA
jgi:hypothetical protein